MRDGIIENVADTRWLVFCGRNELRDAKAFLDGLTPVALWYAYELARDPDNTDIMVDKDGHLLIAINDDANPPGWYHYRKRAASDNDARAYVRERAGDVVTVPIRALLSDKPVGIW